MPLCQLSFTYLKKNILQCLIFFLNEACVKCGTHKYHQLSKFGYFQVHKTARNIWAISGQFLSNFWMFYQSMIHNSIFRYSVHKTARIVSEYVPEVYQYRFSHDGPYSSIPQPSDPPGTLSNQHRRNKHFYAEFG